MNKRACVGETKDELSLTTVGPALEVVRAGKVLEGCRILRMADPVELLLHSGQVAPLVVGILQRQGGEQELLVECVCILSALTTGYIGKPLLDLGIVGYMATLLAAPGSNDVIKYHATIALSNIAGVSAECRALVLAHGNVLVNMVSNLRRPDAPPRLVVDTVRALFNTCRKASGTNEPVDPATMASCGVIGGICGLLESRQDAQLSFFVLQVLNDFDPRLFDQEHLRLIAPYMSHRYEPMSALALQIIYKVKNCA